MNAIVTLMIIVALSLSSRAVAAEKEESALADAAQQYRATPPMADELAAKRPAVLPALYAGLTVMQAWDVYSTSMALKAGAREGNPVAAPFAGNAGSLIGLKVMTTASTIYFVERLWKKNPVKAVLVLAAINGATAAVSMHNMRNVRAASGRR